MIWLRNLLFICFIVLSMALTGCDKDKSSPAVTTPKANPDDKGGGGSSGGGEAVVPPEQVQPEEAEKKDDKANVPQFAQGTFGFLNNEIGIRWTDVERELQTTIGQWQEDLRSLLTQKQEETEVKVHESFEQLPYHTADDVALMINTRLREWAEKDLLPVLTSIEGDEKGEISISPNFSQPRVISHVITEEMKGSLPDAGNFELETLAGRSGFQQSSQGYFTVTLSHLPHKVQIASIGIETVETEDLLRAVNNEFVHPALYQTVKGTFWDGDVVVVIDASSEEPLDDSKKAEIEAQIRERLHLLTQKSFDLNGVYIPSDMTVTSHGGFTRVPDPALYGEPAPKGQGLRWRDVSVWWSTMTSSISEEEARVEAEISSLVRHFQRWRQRQLNTLTQDRKVATAKWQANANEFFDSLDERVDEKSESLHKIKDDFKNFYDKQIESFSQGLQNQGKSAGEKLAQLQKDVSEKVSRLDTARFRDIAKEALDKINDKQLQLSIKDLTDSIETLQPSPALPEGDKPFR